MKKQIVYKEKDEHHMVHTYRS